MSDRDVRHFAVYVDGRLALVVRDEPGPLRSSAGPPARAGGPPPPPPGPDELPPGVHPFVDAQAHDPVSEDRLRRLLDESSSFDEYLHRLVGAGFDVASVRPLEGLDYELPGAVRLQLDGELAGVCWPAPGQFSTLEHQPPEDALVFESATATAYREESAPAMLDALGAASSFDDLLERLGAAGLSAAR